MLSNHTRLSASVSKGKWENTRLNLGELTQRRQAYLIILLYFYLFYYLTLESVNDGGSQYSNIKVSPIFPSGESKIPSSSGPHCSASLLFLHLSEMFNWNVNWEGVYDNTEQGVGDDLVVQMFSW